MYIYKLLIDVGHLIMGVKLRIYFHVKSTMYICTGETATCRKSNIFKHFFPINRNAIDLLDIFKTFLFQPMVASHIQYNFRHMSFFHDDCFAAYM